MLSIAHGPTGAFIASIIPNPVISLPLALAAHYLEDRVPHWDVGQGLSKQTKSKKLAFIQELTIDFPLSILIVFLFFQLGRPFNPIIWLGWFFGLLPDFLEFPHLFLKWNFFPINKLDDIHKYFHRSTPELFLGLAPQIAVLVLIYLFK